MAAAKSVTITARISPALAKKLEAYAKAAKRTRSWVMEDILNRYVDGEMAIVEVVNERIRELDAGLGVPHEEVFRKLHEKSLTRRKAIAKRAG